MKLLGAAGIIEFSSERIMASTYKIVVLSAALLACLSSSSAVVRKRDVDVLENFEKHVSHDAQQFPREKRREEIEEFFKETDNPVRLDDKFSEPQAFHDSKIIEETIDQSRAERKDKEREDAFHTNNDAEKSDEDDMFSYKNMHDFVQAFILADKEGIFDKSQLEEVENSTESEGHNNLPKRHIGVTAAAAAAAAVSSDLLGGNLWEAVPLAHLDAHSCGVEAFEYGHVHVSGVIVHEFFCELRKLWHYLLIVVRSLKEGLTLGPLIVEDVIGNHAHHGIFGHIFSRSPLLLQAIIRHPHHLLTLPEIIHDAIPFPSVTGAIHRVAHILLRLVHFVNDLVIRHVFHIIRHFFLHNHLGAFLREKLLDFRFAKMHLFSSLFPIEQIVTEPVLSASSAVASATACQGSSVVVPDYQTSLAEVMTSFRGIQDGYRASGVPHLIRTGAKSFSSASVISFIRPYLPRIPNFANYFGCQPTLVQDATVSTSSSASVSSLVGPTGPAISPTIIPLAPVNSIEPEIISSSASASAAAVAAEMPLISAAPVPYIPSYTPLIEPIPTISSVIPTISPVIIPDTIGNMVAESSASSVAVTAPEIAGNIFNTLGNTAAAAAASASASSLDVAPTSIISPFTLPRYRPRPILPIISPTIESTASSSASASSSSDIAVEPYQNRRLNWNGYNRFRYPSIRPQVLPSVDSSIAAASSAAASASASDGLLSSAASSAASSAVSSALNGFNLVFPREKVVNALGYDCLTPGDIVTVTLRNRSTLFGRVFDATSPITFNLLRPKLHASIIRNSRRIWNLLPRDFRDPECIQKLNNPLLLRNLY